MEQNREPGNVPTPIWAIYNKGGKNIQWEKTASSINGVGKTGQLHAKKLKWTTLSHHEQK